MTLRGYRKFIIAGGAIFLAFVLACFKLLTPDFATFISIVVPAFLGAHAVADWRGNAKPPQCARANIKEGDRRSYVQRPCSSRG